MRENYTIIFEALDAAKENEKIEDVLSEIGELQETIDNMNSYLTEETCYTLTRI